MRTVICVLFLSALARADNVGTVRLTFYHGLDCFEPTKTGTSVKLLAGEKVVAADFDYLKSQFRIPYGAYTLVVEEPGFSRYRRPIHVLQSETDILVSLELAPVATYAARGRFRGSKAAS